MTLLVKCNICSTEKNMLSHNAKRANSCGCLKRFNSVKHGLSNTRIESIYSGMKDRCLAKNNPSYKDYGGRGITISDDWLESIENFYRDMGEPEPHYSLDRIDNNKGYSKENCRWATARQQQSNTRRNRMITYEGVTMTLTDWSRKIGVHYTTLFKRINKHGVNHQTMSRGSHPNLNEDTMKACEAEYTLLLTGK